MYNQEKISENLETIATLESSLSAVQSELENQKDVTAGLREKGTDILWLKLCICTAMNPLH